MDKKDPRKEFFYNKSFTIRGRLLKPSLTKTVLNQNGTRQVYESGLMWQPDDEKSMEIAKQVMQLCKEFKDKYCPNNNAFMMPIKNYNTYRKKDGQEAAEFLKGHFWLNASTGADFPPRIVDSEGQDVIDDSLIHAGRNALLHFSLYPFSVRGNEGVSINLRAVKLLKGGEAVGGNANINVDEAFGDFKEDMEASKEDNINNDDLWS